MYFNLILTIILLTILELMQMGFGDVGGGEGAILNSSRFGPLGRAPLPNVRSVPAKSSLAAQVLDATRQQSESSPSQIYAGRFVSKGRARTCHNINSASAAGESAVQRPRKSDARDARTHGRK